MGSLLTWTVPINTLEREGVSAWTNCPFEPGTEVFLEVLDLPRVAVRMGSSLARKPARSAWAGQLAPPLYVNGPLLALGAYPNADWPLRVGCELNVLPSWELSAPQEFSANTPEPTLYDNSGVDCQSVDDVVEVWAVSLDPLRVDAVRLFPWVRHGSGLWAQPEGLTALPSGSAVRAVVPVKSADRVYGQVTYTTPITNPYAVLYGRLTAPAVELPNATGVLQPVPPPVVRFGAIQVAPFAARHTP